jgi:hypothetical protein
MGKSGQPAAGAEGQPCQVQQQLMSVSSSTFTLIVQVHDALIASCVRIIAIAERAWVYCSLHDTSHTESMSATSP